MFRGVAGFLSCWRKPCCQIFVKLLTKIESYFSDRLTFSSGRSSRHVETNSTIAFLQKRCPH